MVRTQLMYGNKIARTILEELKKDVTKMTNSGLKRPTIAAILVGQDPASEVYLRKKREACEHIGIGFHLERLDAQTSQHSLHGCIKHFNQDVSTDSVIVQLPLPNELNAYQAITSVKWSKDVDGFHPFNYGRLVYGMETFTPATVAAVKTIITHELGLSWLRGKVVCIVGRSDHICKPLQYWLQNGVDKRQVPGGDATVICVHEHTNEEDFYHFTKIADLIITATGRNEMWLTGEFIKDNVAIIDVAFNRNTTTGKVHGDVDIDSCYGIAQKITPVPGGVGPITVAELMRNIVLSSTESHKAKSRKLELSDNHSFLLDDPETIPLGNIDGLVSDYSVKANSSSATKSRLKRRD